MTKPAKNFDDICREASTAFLQTVIVIDNEASVHADELRAPTTKKTAAKRRSATPGAKTPASAEAALESAQTTPEPSNAEAPGGGADDDPEAHTLKLNRVSRAFAERELTCGVYLPSERDPEDLEKLIRETVAAIHPTDACVLDWQLRVGDSGPAIEAIKSVLQDDEGEGGRLRLILIYTAEELGTASEQLSTALHEAGRAVDLATSGSAPVITGDHFRIAFANKPTRGRSPEVDDAVIGWDGLPEKIVAEFTTLSRGLLRAFALQSVAAVRRDMHRILAQFDKELDPVYAGDRATKPDQADAIALIAEIFNSELAHTVLHSTSAQDSLKEPGILAWLDHSETIELFRDHPSGFKAGDTDHQRIDSETRKWLLRNRLPATTWIKNEKHAAVIRNKFFPDDDSSEDASIKLAALSTLARAKGLALPRSEEIRLNFGTIVRAKVEANGETPPTSKTYLCLQPACDATRIQDSRPFLLVNLVPSNDRFHLAIPENENNEFSRWRLPDKNEREFMTVSFARSEGSDGVRALDTNDEVSSYFEDIEGEKWIWLADLRPLTAVDLRDKALQPFAGVGLNGLEWLRVRTKA